MSAANVGSINSGMLFPSLLRRSAVVDSLTTTLVSSIRTLAPANHVLRFPHYTSLRPVVVLSAPSTCRSPPKLAEQLFVRGLVSTLMAHVHGKVPTNEV